MSEAAVQPERTPPSVAEKKVLGMTRKRMSLFTRQPSGKTTLASTCEVSETERLWSSISLRGAEAANVSGPGGVPVKGSRFAPNRRRFRRGYFRRRGPAAQGNQLVTQEAAESCGERQEGALEKGDGLQQPANQRRHLPPPYFYRSRFRRRPGTPTSPQGGEGTAVSGDELSKNKEPVADSGQAQPQPQPPSQRAASGAKPRSQFRRRPFRAQSQQEGLDGVDENKDPKTDQPLPERRRFRRPFFRRRTNISTQVPAAQEPADADAEVKPADDSSTSGTPAEEASETPPAPAPVLAVPETQANKEPAPLSGETVSTAVAVTAEKTQCVMTLQPEDTHLADKIVEPIPEQPVVTASAAQPDQEQISI
ncbi:Y-box-binding protein 2-A-like isoform X2 [Carcharodon carcharias]|uniref:Y-box-binding protein 2-A-like isoform X2 n=1 Tax=Carcharodon carcharias TaxID=13397 RepID=UPI001B7E2120|nr:Y-box-binding protein 2-A-like isoform X2 [Carcharodon carcharias]